MTVIPWLVESGSQSLGLGTHLQQASNRRFVGDSPSLQRDSADSAQRLDDMRGGYRVSGSDIAPAMGSSLSGTGTREYSGIAY